MIVSLLRECLPGELRVLLLPKDAVQLCEICDLQVETGAGRSLGIPDDAYVARRGADHRHPGRLGNRGSAAQAQAPTLAEVRRIRCGGSIAALFHAEGTPGIVTELLARKITAYSFEYFQDGDGAFPLMAATGEIAGQMAVIYAAYHLQSHLDGSGICLPACTYAPPARVAIIGYGNAGQAAARTALALGAQVTVYTRQVLHGQPRDASRPAFRPLNEPGYG